MAGLILTSQVTELFLAYFTGLLGARLILVQETNPRAASWLELSDGWGARSVF